MLLALNVNNDALEGVAASLSLLEELNKSVDEQPYRGYIPRNLPRNHGGRPKLDIKQEQLEHLLNMGFHCPKIAEVLGVSLSTVRRRMSEFGLSVTALYSSITDHELDVLVSQIKREFPNCGFRLMRGHLLSRGHRVPVARVRDSLHRIDPEGVAIRWISAIERRKYEVFSPLSLWHLDGNHKLIR